MKIWLLGEDYLNSARDFICNKKTLNESIHARCHGSSISERSLLGLAHYRRLHAEDQVDLRGLGARDHRRYGSHDSCGQFYDTEGYGL